MAYRVIGEGQPLVLLHGFGENADVWHRQISFLEKECLLIVPDIPGTGESGMLADMTMEGMATAIKAILEEEKDILTMVSPNGDLVDGKVIMIGHSMGGYITLAFASMYPDHLKAFGLFHSTAFADSEEKKETRRKGIEFIRNHGAEAFLKTAVSNLFSPLTKDEKSEIIEGFSGGLAAFTDESLVAYYEAMIQRPDRTDLLKTTDVPVLFIMGKFDNAAPYQDVLRQTHLPTISHIHTLHRSGHMGMLEETEKSNRILKEFLLEMEKW